MVTGDMVKDGLWLASWPLNPPVIVDLSRVTFMDAAGLRVVVALTSEEWRPAETASTFAGPPRSFAACPSWPDSARCSTTVRVLTRAWSL
jgi:hypothetical protein